MCETCGGALYTRSVFIELETLKSIMFPIVWFHCPSVRQIEVQCLYLGCVLVETEQIFIFLLSFSSLFLFLYNQKKIHGYSSDIILLYFVFDKVPELFATYTHYWFILIPAQLHYSIFPTEHLLYFQNCHIHPMVQ